MRLLPLLILFCFLIYCPSTKAEIVNPKVVYTYKQMVSDIGKMKEIYDDALEITVIGQSAFGNDIPAIRLGEGQEHILLIGAHHGREWLTSTLLMVMLEHYVEAYTKGEKVGPFDPANLEDVSIWFVPMLNPDGVQIQQHDLPPFFVDQIFYMNEGKNNFSRWKANGEGIDLNRQYPAGWKSLRGPSTTNFQFYKGKSPLVAKETMALVTFVEKIQPSIGVAYHSTGQEIYWSFHNGIYKNRDYGVAKEISNLTGYQLGKPSKKAVGGGFTDWFITKYHRPALTIEICPPLIDQAPPLSNFPEVWERNQYVGLKLVEEVKRLKLK